ncbi:hypothetical protein ACFFX0_21635 [Citricoccus parietis]|uniref:Uncharacterized protein n=1 Tax=Citricoccus parietis TaxID=592307 RepID=A0ABV5G431_9MICC
MAISETIDNVANSDVRTSRTQLNGRADQKPASPLTELAGMALLIKT